VRIRIPPLRERREDVPVLIDHLLKEFGATFERVVRSFKSSAMELLMRYDWPGNVRELRNVIEATFVNMPPVVVDITDLPDHVRSTLQARASIPSGERERLVNALVSTNWNKSRTAERLRCSRMTVYRKMKQYAVREDAASVA
jgi:DNA-binding NtrC family response regulator